MKSVSFCTLGCKVNQYETEAMITLFKDKGYEIKNFDEVCDIYVINTCTVTGTGERKSRQMIGRAAKKNPDALIAVAGCYSQVAPEEIKKLGGVGVVVGTKDRSRIVDLCEEYFETGKEADVVSDIMKTREYEKLWITSYEDKTRAFVKIEEGCTEFCSYCIIPYARGPVRSRSTKDITKEVKTLSKNGYREIVLTGIHIGSYGRDLENKSLVDAIEAANEAENIERIRLGSVEPRVLTEEFTDRISKMERVCNHFHISLQSGCDKTLKAMNRKYTTEEYKKSVERLRAKFDRPAITTDIITGFPGETIEDFEKSLAFVEEIGFSEVHVFPFSPRKGTKAADMDCQVEKKERERRAGVMIEKAKELHKKYVDSFVGEKAKVLFERSLAGGVYEGHMTNYIKVKVKSKEDISNKIANVYLVEYDGKCMWGEVCD